MRRFLSAILLFSFMALVCLIAGHIHADGREHRQDGCPICCVAAQAAAHAAQTLPPPPPVFVAAQEIITPQPSQNILFAPALTARAPPVV